MPGPVRPRPVATLVVRVEAPTDPHLRGCLQSVLQQTSDAWQLVVVHPGRWVRDADPVLRAVSADERVLIVGVPDSGDAARAFHEAVAQSEAEYVVLLTSGSRLEPQVVALLETAVVDAPEVHLVYSDFDVVDGTGAVLRSGPLPDWSPQLLRAHCYLQGLVALRTRTFVEVGGLSAELAGAAEHDLLLRVAETHPVVRHVPEALLHRHEVDSSMNDGHDVARHAVTSAHYARSSIRCTLEPAPVAGRLQARVEPRPARASIILPTRGSRGSVHGSERVFVEAALRSVVRHNYAVDYEVVVVHDTAADGAYLARLEQIVGPRLRVVGFDGPFNFSAKINRGVEASTGDYLVLLNDDIEVVSPRWLDQMVGIAQEPDVGAVGAKLLFEDGSIQHAGLMYHAGEFQHVGFHLPNEPGPRSLNFVDREVVGVTAACMTVRRAAWEHVGGMDESLPNNFNDVDLCWRLRSKGYRIVQANSVVLHHFESMTRVSTVDAWEAGRILGRLGDEVNSPDPFTFPEPGEAVRPPHRNVREWIRVSAEVWRTEGGHSFLRKARGRLQL